jgi:Uma2 family endonuclease
MADFDSEPVCNLVCKENSSHEEAIFNLAVASEHVTGMYQRRLPWPFRRVPWYNLLMVATVPTRVPLGRRLFTAADLAALPTSLPSGDVRYELDDGTLITMPPPSHTHARRQARVIRYLTDAEDAGLGEVCGDVGVILRRNPDRVVGPDAAFVLAQSLPVTRSPEGYLETIPEIVVEIRSKNDTNPEIAAKNDEYFRAGVVEVWVIDPTARTAAVCRANQSVTVYPDTGTLVSPLLPGWSVPVANLFLGS